MVMAQHEHSRLQHEHGQHTGGGLRRTWVLIGFFAIAGYFLLTEHRAHFISYLPFLLLLACPLMHLFHRHGGHGRHRRDDAEPRDSGPPPKDRPRYEGDNQ